jgi:hypothetical protein
LAAAIVFVLLPAISCLRADVFSNVPESAGWTLVYTLPIPNNPNLRTSVPYSVDNSTNIADGSFDRVGYYLELQQGTSPTQWVYVSFDAAPFTTKAGKLGVPNAPSGEFYRYGLTEGQVSNMNVFSSPDVGVVTGLVIATGNAEFWPSNYGPGNDWQVPDAQNVYDFGDGQAGTGVGYGSMQIHNYGAKQTVFAFNNWNGGHACDLGIGNKPNGNPDWTFSNNGNNFAVKTLQVVVRTNGTPVAQAANAVTNVPPVPKVAAEKKPVPKAEVEKKPAVKPVVEEVPPAHLTFLIVKITDYAKETSNKLMTSEEYKSLCSEIASEGKQWDKVMAAAEKAWKADEETAKKTFPKSAISPRKAVISETFATEEKAMARMAVLDKLTTSLAESEKKKKEAKSWSRARGDQRTKDIRQKASDQQKALADKARTLFQNKLVEMQSAPVSPDGT